MQLLLCTGYVIGGIILLIFSVRLLNSFQKFDDFHNKTEKELRPQIQEAGRSLEKLQDQLYNVDDKFEAVKNVTDKASNIFTKKD